MKGLDYNTQRSKLRMPEYGRDIHIMVDHCMSLEDRGERQRCAEAIVGIMEQMDPSVRQIPNYKNRLWTHLAIISDFKLDIDYPCDIDGARAITLRPQSLKSPKHRIAIRHYGMIILQSIEHLCTMEPGEERDALASIIANQMKRNLLEYGNANLDNERIISDLASLSNGVIQLDPQTLKFENIAVGRPATSNSAGSRKKRKK